MTNAGPRLTSWDETSDLNAAFPSTGAEPAIFRQVLSAIRRRKFLIATLALAMMCAITAILLIVPKTYQASSEVAVDWKRPEAVRVGAVLEDSPFGTDTMGTELELLNSREILEATVKALRLTSDPEFNWHLRAPLLSRLPSPVGEFMQRWASLADAALTGDGARHADPDQMALNDTVAEVRRHLDAEVVGLSRVIRISFKSHQPQLAAQAVNMIAQLYVNAHANLGEGATQQAHEWIDRRLAELRARADKSASAVEEYRISHDMTPGKDATLLQQEITEVSSQITASRQRAAEASAELQDAGRAAAAHDLGHLNAILNSQTVEKLRELEAQVAARVADLSRRYGPTSPVLAPAAAQLTQARASIRAEQGRIIQAIGDKAKVARANEATLSEHLADLKARVAQSERDTIPLQVLEREAEVDRVLYTNFLTRSKETDPIASYTAPDVRILSSAATPTSPYFPQLATLLPLALVGSIGASVVGIVTWENLRRGLVSMGQVTDLLRLAPLGLIPFYRPRAGRREKVIFDEAVSDLLARVLSTPDGVAPRSILVTSAVPREGKTTVARALACQARDRGRRVLLMDADLRRSTLSASTQATHEGRGLVDVLRGDLPLDEAIQCGWLDQVPLLPAGGWVDSPSHILESPKLPKLLRQLEEQFDLVVIDSPPVLVGGDTWRLARLAGTTLLLARWKFTPAEQVALAVRQLGVAPARLAGLALSMVNTEENSKYVHSDAVLFSTPLKRYYARPQEASARLGSGLGRAPN